MKKIVYIILAFFALILLALILVPVLFKGKILERVDQEIATSVNAQVFFDYDKVSLSAIRRFPNITASLGDFGIVGNPPFERDTLMNVGNLRVDLNLFSVLFQDYPELTGIHLEDGNIHIKVLQDGTANYDITYPSDAPADTAASAFRIGVKRIEVENLGLIYDDRQMDFFMALGAMDLAGSGDFTMDVYDLDIQGGGQIVSVDYEGSNYLSNKLIDMDSRVHVDLDQMLFSLRDAEVALNDFRFGIDGSLGLPDEGIQFDLGFSGVDNSFRSLLSLVPGMYTDSFSGLRTSGEMDFGGFVRGLYTDDALPAFQLALQVRDGMFQYPDLPKPVQEVNLNLKVDNATGIIEQTEVNLSEFALKIGEQPVRGRFFVKDLINYEMDGQLVGNIDLGELTAIFPLEGMTLRGNLAVDASAKGRYDSVAQVIPALNINALLENGYVKSSDYPAPIEEITVRATVVNGTGKMSDFVVDVPAFGFVLEDEPIRGQLALRDMDRLNWVFGVDGSVDIGKLFAMFPMEGVILEGKIRADVDSQGSYADVSAGRYDKVVVNGQVALADLYYASEDLPQGIRIREAVGDFSPRAIQLTRFDSRLGRSEVQATGSLTNYIDYFMGKENTSLKGNLNLTTPSFDVNEWMVSSGEPEVSEEPLQVIELPKDIDFTMGVQAGEIKYDNLTLKDANGQMTLNEGVLRFSDFTTQALGGRLGFSGAYNSNDIAAPLFDFVFDVQSLSIQEAFKTFNTVKTFAPIAEHITGSFTTRFSLSGVLGQDMMPVLSSLDGNGLLRLAETAIRDSQIIQAVTSLTRLNDGATLTLRPFNIQAEIHDGMLKIPPFNLRLWDYEASVQGSTGFDGSINYLVSMQVPVEKFGSQINSLVAGLAGSDLSGTTIPLALNIGGTYQSPRVGLAKGDNLDSYLTDMLRSRVAASTNRVQEELAAEFQAKEDSLKQEIKERAEVAKDSVRKEAEKVIDQTKEKATEEVRTILRGLTRPKPQ